MCFNAAKSYATEWYSDNNGHLALTPIKRAIELVGIDDYLNGDFDSGGQNQEAAVIVRMQRSSGDDFYMMYNRKKGVNSEVVMGGDKVTIVSQGAVHNRQSLLKATLDENSGEQRFENWSDGGDDLVVKVCDRITGPPDVARVIMYIDDGVNSMSCSDILFGAPVPTSEPTSSPTAAPTGSPEPTSEPTSSPTAPPTKSAAPTGNPTKEPSAAPVSCSLASPAARCKRDSDCCSDQCSNEKKKNRRKCLGTVAISGGGIGGVANPTPSPVTDISCVSQEKLEGSCIKSDDCCGSLKCSKGDANTRFCYKKTRSR
jgi:hypothetical protein